MATGTLRLQLVKSGIGYDKWQKRTLNGLGLHKRHQVVERKDIPAVRGMVYSVRHLVKVLDGGDATWRNELQQEAMPSVAAASAKSPWKGSIVVPGPKTDAPKKEKKSAAEKKSGKKAAKQSGKASAAKKG